MLLPSGKSFGDAEAIIYVAVRFNPDREPLETFVAREQESWKGRVTDATITRLPDVVRDVSAQRGKAGQAAAGNAAR